MDFVWKDIFKQSYSAMFDGRCDFNAPFWVIRDMFISSMLIYIFKLTDHIFEKKTHLLPILFTLCSLMMDKQVMTACFIGFLIGYYAEGLNKLTAKFRNFFVVFFAVYCIFLWLKAEKVYPAVFDNYTEYTLIQCFLLIALNRFSLPQRFFSSKPFLLIGKISFGIYSFHWPLTCSVGTVVLLKCIEMQWHPIYTLAASFLVSLICTVVISVVYYFTVEKFGDLTVRWARKLGSNLPQ
jgi:peptidoglycan/LPS O-acetylase OafA/YrhL